MHDAMIQLFRPALGDDELEALAEVFHSGWIGLGPKTAEFEERFADFVGAQHAVAVNSATAALHLACIAAGVGPGDEVLVPTITFVSTAHAAAYCGARPVFVDIDPDTLNVDPDDLARRITSRSRAIVPVHFGGDPCRMDHIHALAERHNLAVIEDAAHACGSWHRGLPVGSLPGTDVTCFSFQAVKNLPVGDGGMLTTDRDDFADRFRRLRWMGIDKSTWDRTEDVVEGRIDGESTRHYAGYGWYYEVQELGFKYHMNDIAAAIGLVQLGKVESANDRRREIAAAYADAFSDLAWLSCPHETSGNRSSWHNYVVRTEHRDALNLHLKERNIASGVHYLPLHLQPYYRRQGQVSLPAAEREWTRLLTLPLYPELLDAGLERVIAAVQSFRPPRRAFAPAGGRKFRIDPPEPIAGDVRPPAPRASHESR
ncbi:MAG: DegT/DnrJ/EryC1/StrS aminotransferase family protein [Planctomycetes bacterium]|nr:DegT/DnrJ/EryC1/StrS aminotransferase family protein [Planctomycetota bacterium]